MSMKKSVVMRKIDNIFGLFLSISTRKLLWFEITKTLIVVKKNKFIALFIVIFGPLSFPVLRNEAVRACIRVSRI